MKEGLHLIGKTLLTILFLLADTLRTFVASILVMFFCIPYSAFMGVRYCYRHSRRSHSEESRSQEEQNQVNHAQARARINARLSKKKHPRLMSQEDVDEKFPLQSYKAAKLFIDKDEITEKKIGVLKEVDEVVPELIGNEDTVKTVTLNEKDNIESVDPTSPNNTTTPNSETSQCFERGPDIESQCSSSESVSESSSSESDDIDDDMRMNIPDDTCAICIDTMSNEEIVRRLSCGHIFHAECVDPWLTTRRAYCPLCKFDYYVAKPEDEEQLNALPPAASRRNHRNHSHEISRNSSTTDLIRSFFGIEPVQRQPPPRRNRHEASDRSQQRHNYYREEFNRRSEHRQQTPPAPMQPMVQTITPPAPAVIAR